MRSIFILLSLIAFVSTANITQADAARRAVTTTRAKSSAGAKARAKLAFHKAQNGKFHWEIKKGSKTTLSGSQTYSSKDKAIQGAVATLIDGQAVKHKDGNSFKVVSSENNKTLAVSEEYSSAGNANKAVKRFTQQVRDVVTTLVRAAVKVTKKEQSSRVRQVASRR